MSEHTRDDFVVSFKPHTGYDAPLLAIKGASAAEVADKVGSVEATGLFAIMAGADVAFKAAFNLGAIGATPAEHPSTVEAPRYTPPAPPAAPGPPGMTAPQCPHGTKVYKTGNGAKGPWKAWMCPAPKGTPGQCAPEWLK